MNSYNRSLMFLGSLLALPNCGVPHLSILDDEFGAGGSGGARASGGSLTTSGASGAQDGDGGTGGGTTGNSDASGGTTGNSDTSGGTTSNGTSDRCGDDTWDGGDPTGDCIPRTLCSEGESEMDSGSSTSDRICSMVTDCAVGQEQIQAGSSNQAIVCRVCVAGEYCAGSDVPAIMCVAGEACVDGASHVDCLASDAFNTDPKDACTPWTSCKGDELEMRPPDGSNDRDCGPLPWAPFGTYEKEIAWSVATDNEGNVYVAGQTVGNLSDSPERTLTDAFLRKYNSSGFEQWTRQFGASGHDYVRSVTTDGNGDVYVAGTTSSQIGDIQAAGLDDAFVRKYNPAGNQLWTRQFGTSEIDVARSVASDGDGNIYIVGYTSGDLEGEDNEGESDAFVRKYNSAGITQWTRLMGTAGSESAYSVATDRSGNIYVAGTTDGDLGGSGNAGQDDAFVRKYNAIGVEQWTRQFGTTVSDFANSVATDSEDNIYLVGPTNYELKVGAEPGPSYSFLRKYSATGVAQWTDLRASMGAVSVATDESNNTYVAGATSGEFDAHVRKYNASGVELWTQSFGSSGLDSVNSVATDGSGNIYVAGKSPGEGGSTGNSDAYVRPVAP